MLRIFNTLTRCKEQFEPLEAGHVGMYTCGPTVYRFAHIGNLRSYLLADWLRRTLEGQGYRVTHVKNITDVGHMRQDMLDRGEDKVIAAARAEGKTPQEIAQFYTDAFMQDEARLQVLPAHIFPRATDNVSEMVDLTRTLFEKGFAYERRGNVYFEVERFPEYGKLSGQVGEGLAEGMRAAADPLKKSQRDFALWKAAEPGRLLKWPSPWGDGFPGWHIECSAMSRKYLGQQIDIHTGGVDNVFPHHEDEIAQSEAAFGKPFVGYWVHGQHLLVDGLKMAKSTGNTYTLEDLERRGFEPLAFRYLCATVHYRSRMNFTFRSLAAAQRGLLRLRGHAQAADGSVAKRASREADRWRKGFQAALNDDLNLPRALAAAWQVARDSLPAPLKRELLLEFDRVLGLDLDRRPELPSLPAEVERLAAERTRLRRGGDYARADELRARVIAAGFEVRDGRDAALILPAPAWARPSAVISSSQDVPSRLEEPAALEWTVVLVAREDRAEAEQAGPGLPRRPQPGRGRRSQRGAAPGPRPDAGTVGQQRRGNGRRVLEPRRATVGRPRGRCRPLGPGDVRPAQLRRDGAAGRGGCHRGLHHRPAAGAGEGSRSPGREVPLLPPPRPRPELRRAQPRLPARHRYGPAPCPPPARGVGANPAGGARPPEQAELLPLPAQVGRPHRPPAGRGAVGYPSAPRSTAICQISSGVKKVVR
ncbi:MAG: cysteine--tRNA ligase [Chloroflexi bacterium]|nr:cysteine--tRNA ligase [Chloroflexota bacterium]